MSTLGAGYSTILWYASDLAAFIYMISLPSLCVSVGQYFLLTPLRPAFPRWVGISTISTAMALGLGWLLVLAGVALANTYGADLAIRSEKMAATIISGSVCGLITGGATGVGASLGQWLVTRPAAELSRVWIGANMIAWGCGLAVIGALVFGMLADATFSF